MLLGLHCAKYAERCTAVIWVGKRVLVLCAAVVACQKQGEKEAKLNLTFTSGLPRVTPSLRKRYCGLKTKPCYRPLDAKMLWYCEMASTGPVSVIPLRH